MRIEVAHSLSQLRPHFLSRSHPKERFAVAQDTLLTPGGLVGLIQRGRAFEIRSYVLRDGYAVVFAQQAWGLFDPRRTVEASEWQFERFSSLRIEEVIRHELEACASAVDSDMDIVCYPVPIDPAEPMEMVGDHGLSCYGGESGQIVLAVWPSDGNLARLGVVLARAFMQTITWASLDGTPTLREVLLLEGQAARFVANRVPELREPWLAPFEEPADHGEMLRHAAQLLGLNEYAELQGNVYGARITAADVPAPRCEPMNTEVRAYAWEVIEPMLASTDPRTIAACLYGDELIAAHGHPALGLTPYAGFQLGYELACAT